MTDAHPAGSGHSGRHGHLTQWAVVGVFAAAVVVAAAMVLSHPWSGASAGPARSLLGPVNVTTRHGAGGSSSATTVPLDAAAFASGACVAQAPTSGDRHQTVFLDAGHGGPDPGADSGQYVAEKTITLPVALDAAALLRARGYRVVLSRTGDSAVARLSPVDLNGPVLTTAGKHADLIARADCANLAGAAALVSVHFDAYPDPSAAGASTLYDTVRPFSSANLALATDLQHDILASLASAGWTVPDRGIMSDSTAGGGEITAAGTAYGHLDLLGPADPGYVDNPTTMPGALVEPLFLTNPAEAAIAIDPAAQQAIAAGIADAVDQFLRT
jgi:N-acetylmuramoyl-L-alanine amidase